MASLFEELELGLQQAIDIKEGKLTGRKTVITIDPITKYDKDDVKRIRTQVGMSQSMFAEYMGVSIKTVEAWERGTNNLSGPVCRVLNIIENSKDELPFYNRVVAS